MMRYKSKRIFTMCNWIFNATKHSMWCFFIGRRLYVRDQKCMFSWCFFPVIQRWIFHPIDSNFLVWFDENFTPPRKPLFGINFDLVLLTNKNKSLNLCSLSYILHFVKIGFQFTFPEKSLARMSFPFAVSFEKNDSQIDLHQCEVWRFAHLVFFSLFIDVRFCVT